MAPPPGTVPKGIPPEDSFEATSMISSVVIPEDEDHTGKNENERKKNINYRREENKKN